MIFISIYLSGQIFRVLTATKYNFLAVLLRKRNNKISTNSKFGTGIIDFELGLVGSSTT